MAFHPNQQQRLVSDKPYSPEAAFANSIVTSAPWGSIIDFATHPAYCGMTLYPRQQTLLRLIFLETDQMTQFDLDVIEEWRHGFMQRRDVFGVQPDIWERVAYLKERGYRRFPEVQAVLGRRASKGMIGGVLGAEQMAYMFSLDDWQAHYGVVPGKDGYLTVVATSQSQAKRHQFRDIAMAVENCAYLQPHIASSKDYELVIRTPADLRRIAGLKTAGMVPDHEIATLHAIAMASNSDVVRGAASFGLFLDEFAFMIQGTGSSKSGEEVYECLAPETKVLCADLIWRPIGELEVGDKVVGYDEYPDKQGGRRKLRETTVLGVRHQEPSPAYRITFVDGTSVVCSSNHRWLRVNYIAKQGGHNGARWSAIDPVHMPGKRTTRPLKVGDHIKLLVEPWETDNTHDGGWLAGMYDGEGCLSTSGPGRRIHLSQTEGAVLDRAQQVLKDFGFDIHLRSGQYANRPAHWKPVWSVDVNRLEQCMRLLGQFRPTRLLQKQKLLWEGRAISNAQNVKTIASIEQVEDQVLVDIETETGTFVAEGLLSHNSAVPSLDQFDPDALIYIPSSPWSKIGQFFNLYKQGSVLMPSYTEKHGMAVTTQTEKSLGVDAAAVIADMTADPMKLVFQGPSWILYQDWQRGPELVGRMRRNPEKFRVERMGQFAEVADQYLDPDKVEAMFAPLDWREPLVEQERGRFDRRYRIHCDPGRTGANFALAVGHVEDAPCSGCGWTVADGGTGWANNAHICPSGGQVWPHVIIDFLHVWRPIDFPADPESGRRTIDYIQVGNDIKGVLNRFRSTEKISFDQWNSAYFMADLRQEFSPTIRVAEVTFTEKANQERYEKFKSAMNLGWVSSYRDGFFDEHFSLLEQELKFLSEKNGRVVKQDFGPVTTKDLADCVQVVTVDLLHDALDRWESSTMTAAAFSASVGSCALSHTAVKFLESRTVASLGMMSSLTINGLGVTNNHLVPRVRIEDVRPGL